MLIRSFHFSFNSVWSYLGMKQSVVKDTNSNQVKFVGLIYPDEGLL